MKKMKDYHINVFYSEEDQGYVADIPDLKACSGFGETQAQALREVLVAKECWLESARSNGKPSSHARMQTSDLSSCMRSSEDHSLFSLFFSGDP